MVEDIRVVITQLDSGRIGLKIDCPYCKQINERIYVFHYSERVK